MTPFPLQLQLWLSPSFPVGSFAYSHGLEWAVQAGRVRDAASAQLWLTDLLQHGAPRNDAVLLAEAWNAVRAGDTGRLREANALALALTGSRERHLETTAQGNAFVATVRAAWMSEALEEVLGALDRQAAYPVAVGAASAAADLPLAATLQAFLASVMSNLISALVRLAVIGQTDGQRIMASLAPEIVAGAEAAARSSMDDLGGAAFLSDIAALEHETQETRMFRT